MSAGNFDYRVTFRRRAAVGAIGAVRGGFSDYGTSVWAAFKEGPARAVGIGSNELQMRSGLLTIRDSSWARGLTISDRVLIEGDEFAIENIRASAQKTGFIEMYVGGVMSGASFAREFDQKGEVVTVRRLVPNLPSVEAKARAIITGYQPDELTGGINQGDRKILLSQPDLEAQSFPEPVRRNDKIVLLRPSRVLNVEDVDDSTYRDAGDLHAYQIRATG